MKKNLLFFLLISTTTFSDDTPIISVMGTGKILAKPNTVRILATVETNDTNSAVANKKNETIINEAIRSLKILGLKNSNIKIENYSLQLRPVFQDSKKIKDLFYVTNKIVILSNEVDKVSQFLETLNNSKVTSISNVEFLINNKKELEDKSYQLAYINAKEKASNIASLENLKLYPKEINLISYPINPILYKTNPIKNNNRVPITTPDTIEIVSNVEATFYMFKK